MGRKKNKNKSDFIKTTSDISLVSWISLFPLGLSLHNGFYFWEMSLVCGRRLFLALISLFYCCFFVEPKIIINGAVYF